MIRIEQVNKRFKKLHALENINPEFSKGQVISLIGPNGSGKTTLIKCILGMVKPDSGRIYFDGELINGDPGYRNRIGYMPQIGRYPDNMKIGQLFKMIRTLRQGNEEDADLLEKFELPSMYEKAMRTLSGGTRQKVSAALAFLFNPEVLILDEPTAGLDPLSSEILKEKIIAEKNKGKLIFITSHVLSDLDELTTDVMYMQDGRIRFFKSMQTLLEETGESKLERAIARIMRGQKLNTANTEEVAAKKPTASIKK